jgi:regulator of sirC expression with transglutaminase-like and TPR domain
MDRKKGSYKIEIPELIHLSKLLDDEDEEVYENIKNRFLMYGEESKNFLNDFINSDYQLIANRSREIISLLNFKLIERKIRELLLNKRNLLERAVILISSYGYPNVDFDNYKTIIDKTANDINSLIEEKNLTTAPPLDKINIINNFLFHKMGFRGNNKKYYEADNSYINKVIDRKTGIPISLSILYLLIAKRLNLPIYGVNLPSHFIIKYQDDKDEFFIDPFNEGIIISKKEAIKFLKQIGISEKEFSEITFLNIAHESDIIKRYINNLINVYEKEDEKLKIKQLTQLKSHFNLIR